MEHYKRRILVWGLALVMVINLIPIQVLATELNDENIIKITQARATAESQIEMTTTTCGGLTIIGSTSAYTYDDDENIIRISRSESLIIKNTDLGTVSTDKIIVQKDITANIILSGVNIDVSTEELKLASGQKIGLSAFTVLGKANITLADETTNILKSGNSKAGLQVEEDGAITIKGEVTGTGSLEAIGGFRAAGIGAGCQKSGGTLKITGGVVTAKGGPDGAGIGSGYDGGGCIIQITGGTVTAEGGFYGAGIGGGHFTTAGSIEITGGIVTAQGGLGGANAGGGAGIGGGKSRGGGTIKISGGIVTAKGGPDAAGIGGGYDGVAGSIEISGGTPIIRATSIQDQTQINNWEGIIFEGKEGKVYRDQTLQQNLIIEEDETLIIDRETTLRIDQGVILTDNGTLTNNGTLINNGTLEGTGVLTGEGTFKIEILTLKYIVDITEQVYTGTQIKPPVIINDVIMGKTFDIDKWEAAYGENINTGMGTIIISQDGQVDITKYFEIIPSDTKFTDGGIKIYKDNKEETDFYYGDEIIIKITPELMGTASSSEMMEMTASFISPTDNEITLFIGEGEDEIQIVESQSVDMGKELTFNIKTTDKSIPASYFTGEKQTITAKYVGNDNMAPHSESTNITLHKRLLNWDKWGEVEDKSYDATTKAAIIVEPTLSEIIEQDKVNVVPGTATFTSPNVGNNIHVIAEGYKVTGDDIGYYIIPDGEPNFTDANITKVGAVVVAQDKRSPVDYEKPAFDFIQTGFVNDEKITDVIFIESPDIDMSVAGEYTITPRGGTIPGGDSTNYEIEYISGKLNLTLDTSELEKVIIDAKAVKKGITINEGVPSSVAIGTKFVNQEIMTAFETAIINAEEILSTALTNKQLNDAIIALQSAKADFINEIKVGTYERPSSDNSDGSEDATNTETKPTTPSTTVPESTMDNLSPTTEVITEVSPYLIGETLTLHTNSECPYNMSTKLPKAFVEILVTEEITEFKVTAGKVDIHLDSQVLQQLKEKMGEDVILTAKRVAENTLEEDTKTVIGTHPVYEISITSNNEELITKLAEGKITIGIPYELKLNEKVENLIAYSIGKSAEIDRVLTSSYDEKEKILHVVTDNSSTIGIGYKEEKITFTDIQNHWAHDNIEFLVTRGVFGGTTKTTFSPDKAMTKAMFVTVLGRCAQISTEDYQAFQFTDVSKDEYYTPYAAWADANGIANGIADTTFAPNSNITREEMMVMLYNYLQETGLSLADVNREETYADNEVIYADNDIISDWAKTAVKQMQKEGILEGKSGDRFEPQATVTRAEVATILRRFIELELKDVSMELCK